MTTLARAKLSKTAVLKCTTAVTAPRIPPVIQSTVAPETIFIEKTLEEPVIVLKEQDKVDIIGPPDPVSNLRPIIRKVLLNETVLQKRLRLMQDATQRWNQQFWEKHNNSFVKEKQNYINSHQVEGQEKKQLNADEMSEFYKEFLDKNWKTHVNYNFIWYKKNFTLLFLAFIVSIESNLKV